MALFVVLVALGLIFRDEYVAVRDLLRGKAVNAAEAVAKGVTGMPSKLQLGANYELLRASGEQIDASDTDRPENTGADLTFSAVMYPYRAMLNSDAQAIYNQIYDNALKRNAERFTLVQPVSEDALSDIMNAVYNDHPELFWVDTAYHYGFLRNGNIVTVTLSFNDTIQNIERAQAAFDAAVEAVVSVAKTKSTDFEREKYVHDTLVEQVTYDVDASMNQSAYSALVEGKTVCAGFSRAFQHILMQMDIPCYYVTGTAAGGDHAWNLLALGSDFYNVDVSWDDAASAAYGTLNYDYFNKTDAAFMQDHVRTEMAKRLPNCDGTLMAFNKKTEQTGGGEAASLPSYRDEGFSKADIIGSMAAYNAFCRDKLIALGVGKHEWRMVVKNAALMEQISAQVKSGGYIEAYAQQVVKALRLSDSRISLHLSYANLADGYILVTQNVTLTGETATSAPVTPAPATAVPATPAPATPAPVTEAPVTPPSETTAAPATEAPLPPETPQPETPSEETPQTFSNGEGAPSGEFADGVAEWFDAFGDAA